MLVNSKERQIAVRSLRILEEALTALNGQITAANPDLLAATASTYMRRIADLQAEIAAYLSAHPADVSKLAAPLQAEVQTA